GLEPFLIVQGEDQPVSRALAWILDGKPTTPIEDHREATPEELRWLQRLVQRPEETRVLQGLSAADLDVLRPAWTLWRVPGWATQYLPVEPRATVSGDRREPPVLETYR